MYERNIAEKGCPLRSSEIFSVAIQAIRESGLYDEVPVDKIPVGKDQKTKQFAIFKHIGNQEYHILLCPSVTSASGRFSSNESLEELLKTLDQCIKDNISPQKIHTHYVINQTQGTEHYVYGYKSPDGELLIQDPFPLPMIQPKHKDDAAEIILGSSPDYRYSNTGDQYNDSDCGHWALLRLQQRMGIKEQDSFFQRHRVLVLVASVILGTLLTAGLIAGVLALTSGFAALGLIPLTIAGSTAGAGGIVGGFWAFIMDTQIEDERVKNGSLLRHYRAAQSIRDSNVVIPSVEATGQNSRSQDLLNERPTEEDFEILLPEPGEPTDPKSTKDEPELESTALAPQ